MKVLFDTNIIMDALQERQPFDIDAKGILIRTQNNEMDGMFTANAAADIFYLYSKVRNVAEAKNALGFLLKYYSVVSVTHEDCTNALSMSIDDFEDALVVICAQKAGVDYIVTRDEKLLQASSPIKIISPKALLAL